MASITLKNIPRELHQNLKKQAKAHHRSLNREVIATLQAAATKKDPIDVPQRLAVARELRGRFKGKTSLKEIQAFKIAGRR